MAYPSSALTVYRPDLAGALEAIDLDMQRQMMIGLQVAPAIEVARAAGQLSKLSMAQLLRQAETARAPGAHYNRPQPGIQFDVYTFQTKEHGWEEPVDDKERAMFGEFVDHELVAAKRARRVVLGALEARVAALGHAVAATSAASVGLDTYATAVPFTDVLTAQIAIRNAIGVPGDTIIMPWDVFQHCRNCTDVIGRVKYWGGQDPNARNMTPMTMASAFDVRQILISRSMYNTANENQTASLSGYWTRTEVIVCKCPETTDHKEVAAFRTFHWAGDGSSIGQTVESYREEATRSTVVRCRMDTDEQAIYAGAAYRLTGVIS